MEDREIVELYWRRDDRAVAETDAKYGPYCRAIAGRILETREDAEECVNDTWLRAWNAMPPRRPAVLSAFLGRITRNLSLSRYRAARRDKRGGGETALALSELEECLPGGVEPEKAWDARRLAECLDAFLRGLPEEERALFLGRYWYLYSAAELARRFGLREGAVRTRLYRCRKRLRAYLEEEGITV